MKRSVQQVNNQYVLEMNYTVSMNPDEVWRWLATTEGIQQWFPELHIEMQTGTLPLLVFEMEGFRQEMTILGYEAPHAIKFEWDQAIVSFSIQALAVETLVSFREEIPTNYQGEYSDAIQDMTGWTIHNYRLEQLLSEQPAPEIEAIHASCRQEIERLVAEWQ